jgi:tetratricopeptide (TPR) repeat protein
MTRSLISIISLTIGIALLVVVSILGYDRWRIERLAETARQEAEQRRDKDEAQRSDHNARIAALRAADKVADPLKRCLEFPDVPPLHWSPAFIAERCRLTALDIITVEQIDAMLAAGDKAGVDATFQDYAMQDASDPKRRGILFRAYEQRFESSNPVIGSVIERWVKASPHSAYALAARGVFRVRTAAEARGSRRTVDTPQENFETMKRLMADAESDLRASLAIKSDFIVPATYLIPAAARLRGSREEIAELGRKAIAIAPDEYRAYIFWSKEASPLWGGSSEELAEIANAAKAREDGNPLMALVAARVRYFNALSPRGRLSLDDYIEILAVAPDTFALDNMGYLPLSPADAPLMTPLVRFEPTVENYMLAASALKKADQSEWSHEYAVRAADLGSPTTPNLESYAEALTATNQFEAAVALNQKMIEVNPRNLDAMTALIVLYEDHLKRHDDAVAMAHRMLEAYPDSSTAWVMLAYTQKRTDTAEYCKSMNRAYPTEPRYRWDFENICAPKEDDRSSSRSNGGQRGQHSGGN